MGDESGAVAESAPAVRVEGRRMTLQIVLWLWKDHRGRRAGVYGPDDVCRVASSIRKNTRMPHDIVCITDWEPEHFPSDIRVIPLWDDHRDLGGCYVRLKAFSPEMRDIIGERFIWLDIDCVITGNLDPVFSRREDAVFWRSCTVSSLPMNGSMVLQTAGARAQVWSTFQGAESAAITRGLNMVGSDQAWMAYVLGHDEAVWTSRRDGVCAFKRDCFKWLPPDARIVFFPGRTKPTNARTRLQHPWIEAHMTGDGPWPRKAMNDRVLRREAQRTRRSILRERAKAARQAAEAQAAAG